MILKNIDQPTEGIKIAVANVQTYCKISSLGNGTLYITDREITWISSATGSKGFSISYPAIVLHAVCTDVSVFPSSEHVFVMVDQRKSVRRRRRAPVLRTILEDDEQRGLELAAAELDDDEDSDDDDEKSLEIRFVPDDKDALNRIYHEIAVGQGENPEEDDPMYDDEDEEEIEDMEDSEQMPDGHWFTADNLGQAELNEEGLAIAQRIFGKGDYQQNQNKPDDDSME